MALPYVNVPEDGRVVDPVEARFNSPSISISFEYEFESLPPPYIVVVLPL